MLYQDRRRDSKSFIVVDDDCGIPPSIVESYQAYQDSGPLAHTDPQSLLLSMSEYDKSQNYNLYDYHPATRPEHGQVYSGFAAHHTYPSSYVGNQSPVPSGLPQSAGVFNPTTTSQQRGTHDPTYYTPPHVQYSGYVDAAAAPRSPPEILSYSPTQGQAGTKLTVHLRSFYDFDLPPVNPLIMFGPKKCPGVLAKAPSQSGQPFHYSLTTDAPPLTPMSTPSPDVRLSLTFEDSQIIWQNPSVEFGAFSYVDQTSFYPPDGTPQLGARKRKLDTEASPRRSPTKKPSLQHLAGAAKVNEATTPSSPFRKPAAAPTHSQARRFSGPDIQQPYTHGLRHTQSQQFFPPAQFPASQTQPWAQLPTPSFSARSPSMATVAAGDKASMQPSPLSGPALVRTSTLHPSPTLSNTVIPVPQQFNPYAIGNAKAMLKLDGELGTMTKDWTDAEWDVGRRLVQFRRSQTGSVITATFEAVTPEERIPNSICVSCIWWAEKEGCYVTSVDTISLLESLVAVRFTVEEKNRIRRNLEGFRPLTVSKTKADSDDFFKLIMGFPNPKPRNIEKDVKVFPWRILAVALKKIIGKYSASYSSIAEIIHNPGSVGPSYPAARALDYEQRPAASPHSTSSSATSHGHAYAPSMASSYPIHHVASTGLGIATGITQATGGPPDLRLAVPPANHFTPWSHPSAHYANDMSAPTREGAPWDLSGSYLHASPAMSMPHSAPVTGLQHSAQPHQYPQHAAPLTMPNPSGMPANSRFVPLQHYQGHSHPTSNA